MKLLKRKEKQRSSEALRLEKLWSGNFGNMYLKRNHNIAKFRAKFWAKVLDKYRVKSILEVGCNKGLNIYWIEKKIPQHDIFGVDINDNALTELHNGFPQVNALYSSAKDLPFKDQYFDMVFTMGVLIHQPQEILPRIMNEIVRCSRKYVLCAEYYSQSITSVPYHGEINVLFKLDFGKKYQELFPELTLLKQGFLSKKEGWDDLTYWIFEKKQ